MTTGVIMTTGGIIVYQVPILYKQALQPTLRKACWRYSLPAVGLALYVSMFFPFWIRGKFIEEVT